MFDDNCLPCFYSPSLSLGLFCSLCRAPNRSIGTRVNCKRFFYARCLCNQAQKMQTKGAFFSERKTICSSSASSFY